MGKRRWIMGDKLMHNFTHFEDNKLTLLPPFADKMPKDDDCGLPEHPNLFELLEISMDKP